MYSVSHVDKSLDKDSVEMTPYFTSCTTSQLRLTHNFVSILVY